MSGRYSRYRIYRDSVTVPDNRKKLLVWLDALMEQTGLRYGFRETPKFFRVWHEDPEGSSDALGTRIVTSYWVDRDSGELYVHNDPIANRKGRRANITLDQIIDRLGAGEVFGIPYRSTASSRRGRG